MPSISDSSERAEPEMVLTMSFCSASSLESRSRSLIPITALSGVRSSWLTLARNWLFDLLASSACRFALLRLRISVEV